MPSYTEDELWDNPAVQYGITGINLNENISNMSIDIEYLTDDKNQFKFVGTVNGKKISNEIQVSWYAREEVIDIIGEKTSSSESGERKQKFDYTLKIKPYKFLGATVNTGTLSYTQPDSNNKMTFDCDNGNPYKQYARVVTKNVNGKPGSYVAPTTMYVEETAYQNQYLGNLNFKGNINKQSETSVKGSFVITQAEYLYKSNTTENPSVGTIVTETTTLDAVTRTRITKVVYVSTVNYVKYYNIYAVNEKATITKNIVYSGNIYAPTYLYIINIRYLSQSK